MKIINKQRVNSFDIKSQNVNVFPFDAFNFDNPNVKNNPNIQAASPWSFKLGSEDLPWTEEKCGIIPSNGWFTSLLSYKDTTLVSETSNDLIKPTTNNLRNSVYGVNGSVFYDLTQLPGYAGKYTILVNFQGKWNYLVSSGLKSTNNLEVTSDSLKIWSGFTFTVSLQLSYTSQSFRELLIIPEEYSLESIEQILNGASTFVQYFKPGEDAPSLTLSAQGLLWKAGDKFIRLSTEASFHGVDLNSGDFIEGEQGWQITSDGNVEFNNGVFRGDLEGATGTFTGSLEAASGTFSGTLDAASGTFTGDLTIGSDNADRQLELGSEGLLVKDSTGKIIHDLVNKGLIINNSYMGHFYSLVQSTQVTIFTDSVTTTDYQRISTTYIPITLTTLGLTDFIGSNIKGVKINFYAYGMVGASKYLATITGGERSVMRLHVRSYYASDVATRLFSDVISMEKDNGIHLVFSGSLDIPVSYNGTLGVELYIGYTNFSTDSDTYYTSLQANPVGVWF